MYIHTVQYSLPASLSLSISPLCCVRVFFCSDGACSMGFMCVLIDYIHIYVGINRYYISS